MHEYDQSPDQLIAELGSLRAEVVALKASNQSLTAALESTQVRMATLDLNFRFLTCNSAYQQEFAHIFGVPVWLGKSWMELLAHSPREQARAGDLRSRSLSGEHFTIIHTVERSPQLPSHYEFSFSPLYDSEKKLMGTAHVIRDITAQRRAEIALQKSRDDLEMRVAERTAELVSLNQQLQLELDERTQVEEALRVSQDRFAGILEIASDAIISVDGHQRITLFNQGAERIFGYTAAEVMHQPLSILMPSRFAGAHHHHVATFGDAAHRARKMGGDRSEVLGRRKDGTEFPAEASISKLQLEHERVFTVILRDVSARKAAEDALARLSRQNELILNAVGDGICGVDLQGHITFVNPAAARLLRYAIDELIGQSIATILPSTRPDHSPYPLEESPTGRALRDGTVYVITDEQFQCRDGTSFPVEYMSTPILEQGAIVGAVVTFRDVSDRRIIEKMKDEFISVVSHELRTPLTSIHGSLGMLASGLIAAESERGRRLLQIAVDSTDRLVRLINDILDIERIESGKVMMMKEVCEVNDLIEESIDGVQAIADRNHITLSVSATAAQIWADPDRIIQILTNLLSNAIKFSTPGSTVWVTAERINGETEVLFKVMDQGRGIPADKLETIFERFQQVDASDSRNQDGTGLGLAICRSITQQHAGHIWVESVLGEGSTFHVTLPIYHHDDGATTTSTPDSPLVMICDDDNAIRALLKTMLERRGYRVATVSTGQEAIQTAIATPPDVLVLDLLMPGMNGWDVMATLKSHTETQALPIIICSVTSPAQSNYPSKGFVSWLGKPIDEVSLIQSLHQALSRSSSRSRILIVEDDTRRAQGWLPLFQHDGLETIYAATAQEAIRLSQQTHPDLIILDLSLPHGDGFAVVEWLRQHTSLYSAPLVLYSTKELNDDERNSLHLGQTDFLINGQITLQEFEHRVMELLHSMTRPRPFTAE